MKTAPMLITNSIFATECRWCDASGEPHSAACPLGERYAQIQQLGGVAWQPSPDQPAGLSRLKEMSVSGT